MTNILEKVIEINANTPDNNEMNVTYVCKALSLLETIGDTLTSLTKLYSAHISKNDITRDITEYITDQLKNTEIQIEIVHDLNKLIKQMRPEGYFDDIVMECRFIEGRYNMLCDVIKNIKIDESTDNAILMI